VCSLEESSTLRLFYVLLLIPGLTRAGVVYEIAVRPVDQSDIALVSRNGPPSPPVVTQYFVEGGKVRVGGPKAKTDYVFKDGTMYVIDNTARTVHVLKHATLSQAAAHYADAVKQLQDAAAKASPDDRAEAERKATDMQLVSDRIRQPVARDYRVTVRFESVDGKACRIWEMREKDAKRLELCVAPAATIPGGVDILSGMKTLSQFRQGSNFAFGVEFGLSEWWSDINTLGGVPLLVREFKYDSQISEVMLSAMRPGVQNTGQFDLPDGYQTQDGPDYVQWFVR
jgi:hypothetical protein